MTEEPKLYKTFYKWYGDLSDEDRELFDEALLSPSVSIRQLFRELKMHEGVKWGDNAIYFHAAQLRSKENEI